MKTALEVVSGHVKTRLLLQACKVLRGGKGLVGAASGEDLQGCSQTKYLTETMSEKESCLSC